MRCSPLLASRLRRGCARSAAKHSKLQGNKTNDFLQAVATFSVARPLASPCVRKFGAFRFCGCVVPPLSSLVVRALLSFPFLRWGRSRQTPSGARLRVARRGSLRTLSVSPPLRRERLRTAPLERRPNPSGICMRLKPRRPPLFRTSGLWCVPVCTSVCTCTSAKRSALSSAAVAFVLGFVRLRSCGAPPVPVALALACLRIRRPKACAARSAACCVLPFLFLCLVVLRPLCLPLPKALRALNSAVVLFSRFFCRVLPRSRACPSANSRAAPPQLLRCFC